MLEDFGDFDFIGAQPYDRVCAYIDEIRSQTPKGLLIVVDGIAKWWPRSQVQLMGRVTDYDERELMLAPRWLFDKKGVAWVSQGEVVGDHF